MPRTLPTSLITARACNLPKVIICATLFSPYFLCTYSSTLSLPSLQKSISKSGSDTLSGFKNRSNINPNLIGSRSVIFRHQATSDPAPDPLPGPTGMSLFFAHRIKSETIKKYPSYFILMIIFNSLKSLSS